jgi:competence protein ComEC
LPLLWLSLAFLLGIVLGKYTTLPWVAWAGAAGAFLLLAFSERVLYARFDFWRRLRKQLPIPAGIVLLFVAAGAARYLISTPPLTNANLAWYNDQGQFILVGRISAPPAVRSDQIRYEISFSELTDPNAPDYAHAERSIKGKALVTMPRWQQWQYGDILLFTGKPLTPAIYPDFSYKDFLAQQGIDSVVYYPVDVQKVGEANGSGFRRWLIAVREGARKVILSVMPQPESGLLEGILLGMENDLPASLRKAYQDTGTAHIIAISGFNMTLLATLLINTFSRLLRRYWGVMVAIVAVAIYTLFVDGSVSVARAAFMASTAAIAHLFGRKQAGLHALILTAALLCLFNPLSIWDISFQLSFMAVFGLVVFGQPLQKSFASLMKKWFGEEKAARFSSPISDYLLVTLAAQLSTLPVIALQFKRISIVSLLANPLILPVQPAILQIGMVTLALGAVSPFLGKLCAMFAWPLLAYTNFIVTAFAKIKGAAMILHPTAALWVLIGFLLILLVFIFRNYFKKQLGSRLAIWLLLLLAAGSFSVWSFYAHRPDGNLHLHALKTSEGTALLVVTPGGNNLLFDLDGDPGEISSALTPLLSPWRYHLDALVLTHPVNETALGDLNEMLPVRSVLTSTAVLRPSAGAYPFQVPETTSLSVVDSRSSLEIEPGLTISVIGEASEVSAFCLQYGEITILIPAGVDYAALKQDHPDLMQSPDVLVLTPEDVAYIPPRLWTELQPGILVWNSLEASPYSGTQALGSQLPYELIMDGNTIWLNSD